MSSITSNSETVNSRRPLLLGGIGQYWVKVKKIQSISPFIAHKVDGHPSVYNKRPPTTEITRANPAEKILTADDVVVDATLTAQEESMLPYEIPPSSMHC